MTDSELARFLREEFPLIAVHYADKPGTDSDDLSKVVMALVALVGEAADAFDKCKGSRGRFSCMDAHDNRCPKARASRPEDWKGEWICTCGSERLDAVLARLRALAPPKEQP